MICIDFFFVFFEDEKGWIWEINGCYKWVILPWLLVFTGLWIEKTHFGLLSVLIINVELGFGAKNCNKIQLKRQE